MTKAHGRRDVPRQLGVEHLVQVRRVRRDTQQKAPQLSSESEPGRHHLPLESLALAPRCPRLYAFAVFEGVVREVYRVAKWLRAVSTFNSRWDGRARRRSPRWEFVGTIAPEPLRRRYVGRYVGDDFPQGNQNPIRYQSRPRPPSRYVLDAPTPRPDTQTGTKEVPFELRRSG